MKIIQENMITEKKLYGLNSYFLDLIKLFEIKKLPKVLMLTGKKGQGKSTLIHHLMAYIFDKKTKILDCVLVPIKNIDCPGVLALGSKAAETYSDKKDTLFLEFIAEALSSLIERNNY